jgi:hypothetical protein
MSIGQVSTLRQLMEPALDAITRPVKRFLLNLKINALYRHRQTFVEQIKNGQQGLRWIDREIATLESDRRRL